MKTSLLLLLTCIYSVLAFAQENIPIGSWRVHFNYERTHLVAQAKERIYCATPFGLFYYDLEDNSLATLSKVNGLSDIGVSALAYHQETDLLVIGYENGNLDLIQGREVLNVTTIKKRDINESKRINHIAFRENQIYVATNFGVLVVNATDGEIREAYLNLGENGAPTKINTTVFFGQSIFLATNSGMLRGQIDPQVNLQDFNNWERFKGTPVADTRIFSAAILNNLVVATNGEYVYAYDGTSWENTNLPASQQELFLLKAQGDLILAISEGGIHAFNSSFESSSFALGQGQSPQDAILANDGSLWFADYSLGLSRLQQQSVSRFVPNGPSQGITGKLRLAGNSIVALPRATTSLYQPLRNGLGYSIFENGNWTVVSTDALQNIDDLVDISPDKRFVASFGDGLLDTKTNILYNETNSPLTLSGSHLLVAGLASDPHGNTWVAQSGSSPLHRLDADGNWQTLPINSRAAETPAEVQLSPRGNVWIQVSNTFSGGIVAYDPENQQTRYITATNGNLPSTRVNDIAFGKDEEIWIATDNGPAFFPFSLGVIADNTLEVSRPIFENRFLLRDEPITAIEIDGGNRKWIGTHDGLWLLEDNADKVVHFFNTDNSPLLSNNILDLLIHPSTGELYIATDKGLISFRTDATEAKPTHQEVKIFPNPVTPGYTGLVGISGLASDAVVKITTVSGRLVKELHAAGGSTSWDMADHQGRRAESGVYLVFSATSDGKDTFVGKIAIIN